MKSVVYCGSSEKDIRHFEAKAKQRILRLLDMLRSGLELHPKDFKYIGGTIVTSQKVWSFLLTFILRRSVSFPRKRESSYSDDSGSPLTRG